MQSIEIIYINVNLKIKIMALGSCPVKLASDLAKNCIDSVVGGLEKDFYLANADDVDIAATKASKVAGSKNLYASLVMKDGTKAYLCDNLNNVVATKVDGLYASKIQKVITGALMDDGDVPGSIIDALSSNEGRFIAVVRHIYKDLGRTLSPGSSAFEIIGLDVPLTSKGQAIANDKNSADTDGGWAFALGTSEPRARAYWYATNYTATLALYNALGTVVV